MAIYGANALAARDNLNGIMAHWTLASTKAMRKNTFAPIAAKMRRLIVGGRKISLSMHESLPQARALK